MLEDELAPLEPARLSLHDTIFQAFKYQPHFKVMIEQMDLAMRASRTLIESQGPRGPEDDEYDAALGRLNACLGQLKLYRDKWDMKP
jgi:hypothetical protein